LHGFKTLARHLRPEQTVPRESRGFLEAMVDDGRPLVSLTGVCLTLSGAFALFQSVQLIAFDHLYHLEHHLYPAVPHHHWRELAERLAPHFERAGVKPYRRT
jgi:hypothetical protein